MNLYRYYTEPRDLNGYRDRDSHVPEYAYDELEALRNHMSTDQVEKYEKVISSSAMYSAKYAIYVLDDRFPLGEPAIKKVPEWRNLYNINLGTDI